MTKNLKAAKRLVAFSIEQKLQRLKERRTGQPYSGTYYVPSSNIDLDRVVPHVDGDDDHDLHVAVDKLDRMPNRRHNFGPDDIDVGSMTRPIGQEVVRKLSAGRETGFGAGVLLFCEPTGRFLFVKRSETGDQPGTWCTGGGGVEDNETIHEAVERENMEELGYDKPLELIHMDRQVSPDGSFIFHNHMAVIDEEFEPVLNDEHTEHKWCEADDLPSPLHPGLELALQNWMKRQGASA